MMSNYNPKEPQSDSHRHSTAPSLFQITFASLPAVGFGKYDVAIDNVNFEDCRAGTELVNPGNKNCAQKQLEW